MDIKEYVIGEEKNGTRLDVYLTEYLGEKSRSFVQGLIDGNNVSVNNLAKKSNYRLKTRDRIKVVIPEPVELSLEGEDIPLDIMYEDTDIIVVNKPQGMVVHPANGVYSGTLVNALLNHCKDLSGINGVLRPGIVHRIDKDTAGVLVVAKNDYAHNKLAEQLKDHSMTRVYNAIVEGNLKADNGTIDAPLGRDPVERIKIAVVKDGRRAVTHFQVLERYKNHSLIECRLETGRTHQIRVHMAHIGHPLVGDPVYGYKKQKFNVEGQMLFAKILGFIHPRSGEYMEFQAVMPESFKKVLNILRNELK